ncbi:HAD family hydrolase [Amycolatopsis pigmentata]|uniref:HAD family hydrolase n=1 Tax=Amycolatopsis pigmentata TaxID=450801 RepID=A0ABW5FWV3_9PSEU
MVGDTPNDVRAGLMAGARVIGVPTGNSTEEELRAAGATNIVASLVDVVALQEFMEATGLSHP